MWTISGLADEIAGSLADGETDGHCLRLVRQFLMDIKPAEAFRLIEDAPPPTGQEHWDAFLAGLAEFVAFRHGAKTPHWSVAPERFLRSWWFVMPFPSLHGLAMVETPAAFANRGVFIRRASLVNV